MTGMFSGGGRSPDVSISAKPQPTGHGPTESFSHPISPSAMAIWASMGGSRIKTWFFCKLLRALLPGLPPRRTVTVGDPSKGQTFTRSGACDMAPSMRLAVAGTGGKHAPQSRHCQPDGEWLYPALYPALYPRSVPKLVGQTRCEG